VGPSTAALGTVGPNAVGPNAVGPNAAALDVVGPNQTKIPVALKQKELSVDLLISAGIYYLVTLKIVPPKIYKKSQSEKQYGMTKWLNFGKKKKLKKSCRIMEAPGEPRSISINVSNS
jgi:hypothetical protein